MTKAELEFIARLIAQGVPLELATVKRLHAHALELHDLASAAGEFVAMLLATNAGTIDSKSPLAVGLWAHANRDAFEQLGMLEVPA